MIEKLIRPVRCRICKQPLFYYGDKRNTPEVRVTVFSDDAEDEFYAHVKCWNERMDLQ